jgi:phage N-6-adenine-methyltransferase
MNHYTRALAALKAQPAHKLGEVGDQWQTPPALFWGINAVFGPFLIDLFTDGENSKCPRFYTAESNALVQDWAADLAGGKAFANPPYSRSTYDDDKQAITGMRNIMAKVMTEREKGARIVMLLKSATSEVWWPEQADHVAFVRGRISFDLPQWFVPATDKDKASSAGFAVALCVFDKEWRGQPMQYIERDTLLAQGNAIISMIEQRASELAQQYANATLEQQPGDAEPGELVSNPCQLPEPELSTDALQLEAEPEQSIPVSLLLPLIERVRNKTRRWPHNPDFWTNEHYQEGISWFHRYLELAIQDPESVLSAIDCPIPMAPQWTPKLLKAAAKKWDEEDAEPLADLIARKQLHETTATDTNDGTKVCTSETEETETQPVLSAENDQQAEPELPITEEPAAIVSEKPASIEIPVLEFTSEQLAEQLASGKITFDGDHLALMLQLDGMFGKSDKYTSKQIKAAILAHDEPAMVSKTEPQQKQNPETATAQAKTEKSTKANLNGRSPDPHDHYELLGIPEEMQTMEGKRVDGKWYMGCSSLWILKTEHLDKKRPFIQIPSKMVAKTQQYYPRLEAYAPLYNTGDKRVLIGTYTSWDAATKAVAQYISENEQAEKAEAESAHKWPIEVTQIVHCAITAEQYQQTCPPELFDRLCESVNKMILAPGSTTLAVSQHVKAMINDHRETGAAA